MYWILFLIQLTLPHTWIYTSIELQERLMSNTRDKDMSFSAKNCYRIKSQRDVNLKTPQWQTYLHFGKKVSRRKGLKIYSYQDAPCIVHDGALIFSNQMRSSCHKSEGRSVKHIGPSFSQYPKKLGLTKWWLMICTIQ